MKMGRSVTQGFLVAGSLLLAIGLLSGTALADDDDDDNDKDKVKIVKCDKGKTIAKALKKGNKRKPLVIIVRGTCKENVLITRDDVTLRGDKDVGGTVEAANPDDHTILIRGARRVELDNLTVKGASNASGVEGSQGASFAVAYNSVIRENRNGVVVSRGSRGTIEESTVADNSRDGVLVFAATAFVSNSTIESNGRVGINVTQGGTINLRGNDVLNNGEPGFAIGRATARINGGNTFQGNGAAGIAVNQGVLVQFGTDTIQGNGADGIFANDASVSLQSAVITGNDQNGIHLMLHSVLSIGGTSRIEANTFHGILLSLDSGVLVQFPPPGGSPVPITGNGTTPFGGSGIFCVDTESSVAGDTSGVTGNTTDQVDCTDFNQVP